MEIWIAAGAILGFILIVCVGIVGWVFLKTPADEWEDEDEFPVPDGWPDVFVPEQAETMIAVMREEASLTQREADLVVELQWAIAQLRAEREAA